MSLNIKLLRSLVLWAMGEDERVSKKYAKLSEFVWHQEDWARQERNGVCQTAFCMAGAAVSVSGYKIAWPDHSGWWTDVSELRPDHIKEVEMRTASLCKKKGSEELYNIDTVAEKLLGIDVDEANELFSGDNDIADVIRAASYIATRHGETLFKEKHIVNLPDKQRELLNRVLPSTYQTA